MYEIYLTPHGKASYTYKTRQGLENRLRKLSALRSIRSVQVRKVSSTSFHFDYWTRVYFNGGSIRFDLTIP